MTEQLPLRSSNGGVVLNYVLKLELAPYKRVTGKSL